MRQLTEIYGTKYFAAHFAVDLRYFFNTAYNCMQDRTYVPVSENPKFIEAMEHFRDQGIVEIDLAEARFVPDTMAIVQAATLKGVILSDTLNSARDAILMENRRRAKLDYPTIPLPDFTSMDEIVNYIKNLREDVTYVIGKMNLRLAVPLVTVITIHKPNVMIDMETHYEALFRYVREGVSLEDQIYDEYNYVQGTTFYTDKFVNGKIYVQGTGYIDYRVFYNEFVAVPTAFGKERLARDERWRLLKLSALDDIRSYMMHRRTTITDIYPRRD